MNSATKTTVSIVWRVNDRYRLEESKVDKQAFDVIDRARELQFLDGVIFSNGTESECRDWVLRNCEEPAEHAPTPWVVARNSRGTMLSIISDPEDGFVGSVCAINMNRSAAKTNAALIATAPKLLALLEQYHAAMPTKESGKLICQARGWLIQE